MKYLKIGLTIIITSLALNLVSVSAAGSVSVSASANYVEEGNRVTFYINLKRLDLKYTLDFIMIVEG